MYVNANGCWHGPFWVRRRLRSGKLLLRNAAGHVLLVERQEVTLKRAETVVLESGL